MGSKWDNTGQAGGRLMMKVFIILMFAGISDILKSKKEECLCWEDFYPEKGPEGHYYCRGSKHHRIFGCNEEKPPICKCLVDGKIVEMDLGELNCLAVNSRNGRWCHNMEEMEPFFKNHPARVIYD